MITRTALTSPRYLQTLKDATLKAIRQSHRQVAPAAAVWIPNRKGEANIYVQARRGRHVQFFDVDGRNITDMVMGGLAVWHRGAL